MVSDLRQTSRRLRRHAGFTAFAVATLALAIGTSVTLFTIVNSVLLRPLAFPDPEQLTMLRLSSGSRVSRPYLREWRDHRRAFADLAGWRDRQAIVTIRGAAVAAPADEATTNFFAVLRMPPLLGRTFTPQPDLSRIVPEVVLSYGFWQRHFGGDPQVVGQAIAINDTAYTIVGVMPSGFAIKTLELAESRADLWLPMALPPATPAGMGGDTHAIGRLRDGATLAQARDELTRTASRIEAAHPSFSHDWQVDAVPLLDATVQDARPLLLMLFGSVALLALIGCVNIASLLLARAATRRPEIATRVALGATRWQLARLFLTESALLAVIGGVLAVPLAAWGTRLIVASLPPSLDIPRTGEVTIDASVMMFAVATTVLVAVIAGVWPALRSIGPATRSMLNPLVAAQVALALLLVSAAGLVVRSFWELHQVESGFDAAPVLTLRIVLPESRYDTGPRVEEVLGALVQGIAGIPGVTHVGAVDRLPLDRYVAPVADRFVIDARPETRLDQQKFSWLSIVGGEYFQAMTIPLVRGRLPDQSDVSTTEPVFVIDEQLAARYWPDDDPVGARITWPAEEGPALSGRIIGVVGTVRAGALAAAPPATAYWWLPHVPRRQLTLVVRISGDATAAAGAVVARIRDIDPLIPVSDIMPMAGIVAADIARPRATTWVLTGFAVASLLLVSIALYGVLSLAVTQRTREIGIRMALGARSADVQLSILRLGGWLIASGAAAGLAAFLALRQFLAGMLYGVAPTDAPTLLLAMATLAVVGLFATYVPARRATHVNPSIALRS